MGEIINLRKARKELERKQKTADAETARAKHGQKKAVKKLFAAKDEKAKRDLDAHKRDKEPNS